MSADSGRKSGPFLRFLHPVVPKMMPTMAAFALFLCYVQSMKPSIGLESHREEIRRIVLMNHGLNPRVFGSVLHGEDTEGSDLDILIDATDDLSLFDVARISLAVGRLIQAKVDVKTPEDISPLFRDDVIAEARPV
jgi:predicted nucleotidyltransferase